MSILRKSRILCIALFIAVIATIIAPIGSFTTSASETEGYYTYSVSDGKATITDVDTSISGDITVPSSLGGYPVTTIGQAAFLDCNKLTSVTISNGVTRINDSAFTYCASLISLTIPEGVTYIGNYAFIGCDNLTNIAIPDTLTSFGESLFSTSKLFYNTYDNAKYLGNENNPYVFLIDVTSHDISSCEINPNTKLFYHYAFYGCTKLTSIIIPDSVTNIGFFGTFMGCSNLTSVTIGNSVTFIGESAFSGCKSLTDIIIPDSVTFISYSSFDNNNNLTFLVNKGSYAHQFALDNNIAFKAINLFDYVIENDKATITGYNGEGGDVIIPSTIGGYPVTSIGYAAFSYCAGLTSVVIPDTVTCIGNFAFSDCVNLTYIDIPDSVTSIGGLAFCCCRSLTNIKIPDGVTTIESNVFAGCSSLTSITIPNTVTSIGFAAFSGCDSLISVVIPDSVTNIEDEAFTVCKNLAKVVIGNGVKNINSYDVFYGCSNLTSVFIPNSVMSMRSGIFDGCDNLTIYGSSDAYAKEYAIDNGIKYVVIEKSTIKFVSYNVSGNKVIFTVTTTSDINRVKILTVDNLSYCIAYTSSYTVDADGNYLWTIKINKPTESISYAFDARNATTNKYLKDYYKYNVTL